MTDYDSILKEDGGLILQESGFGISLESSPTSSSTTTSSTTTSSTTSSTTTMFITPSEDAVTIVPILEISRTYRQWD